ncbi:transposase family protein [bacterium]|nr:transposase family protein [bacterium]
MLSYDQIKDKSRILRACTSLDREEFEKLLVAFQKAWETYIQNNYINGKKRQREYGGGRKPTLLTIKDKLLFILFYFKTYPLQEVIAFLFGMSQSQANEWIHTLSEALKMALGEDGHLPERDPQALKKVVFEQSVA